MSPVNSEAHLPWRIRLRLIRRRWEHRGRNLLLALLRWILRNGRQTGKSSGGSELHQERAVVQRILIIRTGKPIGDAIMSLALASGCRKLFPNARVDFLLRDNISALFLEGAGIDHVLEWHPRVWKRPGDTFRMFRALRHHRYDLAVACDNPFKSSFTTLFFTLLTDARHRVGFENEESRAFLNLPVAPVRDQHTVFNLMRLLTPFGETASLSLPRLIPSGDAAKEADRLLAEPPCAGRNRPGKGGEGRLLGPDYKPILIFASNHWRKSWPLEPFVRLATEFTRRKYHVLLAFGPGDGRTDHPIVCQWIKQSNGLGRVLPPQKLTVLAAILKRCRLFVANDCGPYHLAVSVGTPCVAAFRIKEGQREFGYEEPNRLVTVYHPVLEEAERLTLEAGLKLIGAF